MNAMRDYVTPNERTDIFPDFDLKKKFVVEELNNIFHRKVIDDERQRKLEGSLRVLNSKERH